MKYIKLIILSLSIFMLSACGNTKVIEPMTNVPVSPESLLGEYTASSQIGDVTLKFREDSTVNYKVSALSDEEQIEGCYQLNGTELIIMNSDGDKIEAIYDKTNDTITIEDLSLAYNSKKN